MRHKSPEINFLKKQGTVLKLQSKRLYLIQILSVVTIIGYIIVVSGIYSYSYFLNSQIKNEQEKIDYEKTVLERLSGTERTYSNLKDKTSKTVNITKSMQNHRAFVEAVFNLLPEGLTVSSFDIAEGGIITFNVTTPDPDIMTEFFHNIEKAQQDNVATKYAKVDTLAINNFGEYSISIKLKMEVVDPSLLSLR